MAERFLPFTHLVFLLGLALLYSIHLNTKPTVTAGGGAAASTSKRFAILRASHDDSLNVPPTYFRSEVPDDLSQCLIARWQAGPDWCKGTACKLRTDILHCIPTTLRIDGLWGPSYCNKLNRAADPPSWPPTPTIFQNRRVEATKLPPVNEMLEWVEDCGWTLHSASSAARLRQEMYVFARPKL